MFTDFANVNNDLIVHLIFYNIPQMFNDGILNLIYFVLGSN